MAIKRRTRKPLSLDELRCSMSTALRELETIYMNEATEPEQDAERKTELIQTLFDAVPEQTRSRAYVE